MFKIQKNSLLTARIAGIIVTLVGCLVLIGGWGLDLTFFKSGIAGAAQMKANTALCFILAGVSLGLQTRRRSYGIAHGCAIAVLLIGGLTLSQYLFGWNLGIDELLFQDVPVSSLTIKYSGRMGDNTALNWVLIGLALYLVGQKTRHSDRSVQISTVMAAAIALLALVGYAYNVQVFYQFIVYSTSMALHTALTFLVLCVGILSIRADYGLIEMLTSDLIGGILVRRLMPIAIAVPLLLGWLILQGLRANLYDVAFSLALLVILLILILVLIIWENAQKLNQTDYDRNRSSERLRSSKERLQLALQGAGQGIWDWNLKTEVLTWDDRCKEIFGLLADFPITYEWHLNALHPEDRQRVSDAATIALGDRTEFNEEYRTFHPDGTMHWILARGRGYYDGSGEPYRISGTVMDISERRQAEADLADSERRYRYIFESVGVSIWEEDFSEVKAAIDQFKASGIQDFSSYFAEHREFVQWAIGAIRILDVNSLSLQLTGATDKAQLLTSLHQIFLPETIPAFIDELLAIAEGKTFFQSEALVRTIQGEKLYVLFSITFPPPTEPYDRVLVTWIDISDRKRAQLNEQFLNELDLRLRQLNNAEAMVWEAVSSLGEYLNVDRCLWHEVDQENGTAIVARNWRREDVADLAGTYPLENFFTSEQFDRLAAGQPIIVPDVTTHASTAFHAQSYQPLTVAAFVATPCIQSGGRWVANLSINCTTVRNWREDEVRILQETVARLWSIIEQTRALQKLSESEERLRLALTAANQGLYDLNVQTGETIVSPEYAQMLGYDPETFQETNAKWRERLHPDDWESVSQIYEEYIEGERSEYCVEFRQRSQFGDWKWILSLGKIVTWDAEGKPLRMLGTHTDISDRKQTEAALAENNNILQAVISGTKDIIYVKDLQGRYVLSNQAAAQWLNITVNSMMGQDDLALFPAEVAQRIQTEDRRVVDANESVIYEEQLLKGDELRSLITGKYPWRNEQGEVKGIIGISRDVTDFKQAEADLQQRNEYIQILYETSRDLLSTYQPLTLIDALFDKLKPLIGLDVYFNYIVDEQQQKLHLMFHSGISEEVAREIEWLEIGQAICGTVAQQQCQIVQDNLQQSTDPKTELVRALGLTAYSCQPLTAQGKLFGTLGFGSRTRTEFTLAETKLFQAICDRIAIALERTEILSSLQQQTEELTRANRLKDEFLAALSHELRTPLNPIMGWTKLLQTQNLTSSKTQEALSTIERNVKQQIALVEDLLDVSRVVQGQFRLTSQPVDLAPILNAARDSVSFAAIAKSITLELHYPADSISQVMGDELRLQQVFWNLLSNAIKFTPDNGRVDVWLEQVQNDAQIRITDTGIGIATEFLPYVFDRFRQADGSSTRRYGGLGLGLALVKHLVELHGGTVSAESLGEGRGATFKVNLPLLKSASSNPTTSNSQQPQTDLSSSVTSESLTGIRVLVVDDQPDNLDLLDFVLTQEGAIVTSVTCATEALAIIAENPPDILVSDIGMPDMDGYELLRQVRALPSQQKKPIKAIALTAFAQQEDQERILKAGFQAYLSKPCNLVDLIAAIAREVAQ